MVTSSLTVNKMMVTAFWQSQLQEQPTASEHAFWSKPGNESRATLSAFTCRRRCVVDGLRDGGKMAAASAHAQYSADKNHVKLNTRNTEQRWRV